MNTLEVKVGLRTRQIVSHPFVVNLIQIIRQQDKTRNHTLAPTALDRGRHFAVPDVVVERIETARGAVWHGQPQTVVLDLRITTIHPVIFGRVPQIMIVQNSIIQASERVGLVLADRLGRAAVQGERLQRVAASQTVGSYTTLST